MMRERIVQPSIDHQQFKADVYVLLKKYEALPAPELLAISAQIVGMVLAFQDQTRMTKRIAMEIVARNIEIGNAVAIDLLRNEPARGTA